MDAKPPTPLLLETTPTGRHYVVIGQVPLFDTSLRIWWFVDRYIQTHGWAPAFKETGEALGLQSSSSVHYHMARLERVGVLRKKPMASRAIQIVIPYARIAKRPGPTNVLPSVKHWKHELSEVA